MNSDPECQLRLVIHAPNVHQGGGLVLLRAMLQVPSLPLRFAFLDKRVKNGMPSVEGAVVQYVQRSLRGRLWAEWKLWLDSRNSDTLLCFHGLPPLLPHRGTVVIFIQNRLLIESCSLSGHPLPARLRLWTERLWCRVLQRRNSRYIVQTPSMAEAVSRWLRFPAAVSIAPFALDIPPGPVRTSKQFDFVFVSSGEPHKNHIALIEAWKILAASGLKPSLALTLDRDVNPSLCMHIEQCALTHDLAVTNLGELPWEKVMDLYRMSGALVFPSKMESFGLPLIEAARLGLPILASELDYVRDVVHPDQTFDPDSPVSIARAVRRHLEQPCPPVRIGTASHFLDEVLK